MKIFLKSEAARSSRQLHALMSADLLARVLAGGNVGEVMNDRRHC